MLSRRLAEMAGGVGWRKIDSLQGDNSSGCGNYNADPCHGMLEQKVSNHKRSFIENPLPDLFQLMYAA